MGNSFIEMKFIIKIIKFLVEKPFYCLINAQIFCLTKTKLNI